MYHHDSSDMPRRVTYYSIGVRQNFKLFAIEDGAHIIDDKPDVRRLSLDRPGKWTPQNTGYSGGICETGDSIHTNQEQKLETKLV